MRGSRLWADARGFSIVEALVASGVFLLLLAAVVGAFQSSDSVATAQVERGDMQQRQRAAFDALRRDMAGAGAAAAPQRGGGAWLELAPPVLPRRSGLRGADPPETFRSDTMTILASLPLPAASMVTAQPMPARSDIVRVVPGPACPPGDSVCGLTVGQDVLIADGRGAYDVFSIVDVTPPLIHLRHNAPDGALVYPIGSALVPVSVRTYYRRAASAARPPQLVRYDGASGPDSPVVDHVIGLRFEYLGDPEPPRMLRPLSGSGPWTSYGPPPPAADTAVVPHVAGSNCVFETNGTTLAGSRLSSLPGAPSTLVPIGAPMLVDGPWCPDELAPNRFDADLLRIRSVQVTLRLESALDALRGPAGALFLRGGTARAGSRYVPDIELRFRVALQNLTGWR